MSSHSHSHSGCGSGHCPCKSNNNNNNKTEFETPYELTDELKKDIIELVNSSPIMLFIKGDYNNPKCKWSRRLMHLILDYKLAKFSYFNILNDTHIRQGLKDIYQYKTYPQIYIHGQLLGGYDDLLKVLQQEQEQEQQQEEEEGKALMIGKEYYGSISPTIRIRLYINQPNWVILLPNIEIKNEIIDLLKQYNIEKYNIYDCSNEELTLGVTLLNPNQHPFTQPQLYIDREYYPQQQELSFQQFIIHVIQEEEKKKNID